MLRPLSRTNRNGTPASVYVSGLKAPSAPLGGATAGGGASSDNISGQPPTGFSFILVKGDILTLNTNPIVMRTP